MSKLIYTPYSQPMTLPTANRSAATAQLAQFAASGLRAYAKSRNFDFGPKRRGNVSMLSPYLRHRLLLEAEVLETSLEKNSLASIEKFAQEVVWRTYFKGWLEHRPAVWADYRTSTRRLIESLDRNGGLRKRYESAIAGRTGIECFDAWVSELEATGYLHNHARMWFASIWIFTLQLPWQLGADFFYRLLLDGDAASNTLSWRWVGGLHTVGKFYLASASNIERFTDGRFHPAGQLATEAQSLVEDREYSPEKLIDHDVDIGDKPYGLLVTEEDCHAESLRLPQNPAAMIGLLATQHRSPLPVGSAASDFARGAVEDGVARGSKHFGIDGLVGDGTNWAQALIDWAKQHQLDIIVTGYAPVGPVADVLEACRDTLEQRGIKLFQIQRDYDKAVWPHASRGFFKVKKKIPALLSQLGLRKGE